MLLVALGERGASSLIQVMLRTGDPPTTQVSLASDKVCKETLRGCCSITGAELVPVELIRHNSIKCTY